ncbi:RNase H domain-containing protein [Nephila pilipes]|uniref:RNase H domain-containing protein n=1 Tax=Nephila pilipes TaxID=299642 RepID=A0A8X6Q5L8_NEPPI|nr:RNase H domain-containing protein [Nephila pilipes]
MIQKRENVVTFLATDIAFNVFNGGYYVCFHSIFDLTDSVNSQNSRVCVEWIPSHVGVFGNEMADLLAKAEIALPLLPPTNTSCPKYFLCTGQKQILLRESLSFTIGMMEIILVCLYWPKVRNPHRQHWPDCLVASAKA